MISLDPACHNYFRTTHEITRYAQLLVEDLHPALDLHVVPHRIVQLLQTRLAPEQFGHVEDIRDQINVLAQLEEPPGELERVVAFKLEGA